MKVLHHTLTVMTGHGLDAYVVPAPPDIMQTPETLTFAAKPERRMIRAVEDEEGCQTKAWNYLAEVAGLRCLVEPELCHPLWNAFKRSVRYAGLETSVLKLTVLCNHSHGAFLSGERYHTRQEIVGDFLAAQGDEFFLDVAESLAFDRGESYDPDQVPDRFREWMDSPAIARRGLFVTQRHYFQCISCVPGLRRGCNTLLHGPAESVSHFWLFPVGPNQACRPASQPRKGVLPRRPWWIRCAVRTAGCFAVRVSCHSQMLQSVQRYGGICRNDCRRTPSLSRGVRLGCPHRWRV